MKLRLRIKRDGLADVNIPWIVEDGLASRSKTFARLLEDVNDRFPLVTPARHLSDYVVEFSGLECLSDLSLWDLLEDDDELCIYPKQMASIQVDSHSSLQFEEDNPRLEGDEHVSEQRPSFDEDFTGRNREGFQLDSDLSSLGSFKSWESIETSESLHDCFRHNSHGELAQNYHHDHLLHQKWPSKSRPPLRAGECAICPRRRTQEKIRMGKIEAFAEEGCFYCQIIREIIARHAPTQRFSSTSYALNWLGGAWYEFGIDCNAHDNDKDPNLDCIVEIFLPPKDGSSVDDLPTANLTSGNTGSEDALLKASSWIQQCVEKHERCGSHTNELLPRRILDLGTLETGGELKLHETDDETGRYICLSHCWGDADYPAKTTTLTLNQNKVNIPWGSLPKTFQDAITFTRWLKIRFLWIDSLCIVQDSKEDWQVESAKMVDIYRRSFLTIAATRSMSDHWGCFSTISPEMQAKKLHGHTSNGKPYELYFRTPLRHATVGNYDVNPDPLEYAGPNHFPVLGRAWCYQEILLSPRVLHFAKDEITWECMEDTDCECAGLSSPFQISCSSEGHDPPKIHHSLAFERNLSSADGIEERWRAIVEEYSSLKFTFEKDKFPALSGLAKQMQLHRPGDTYLAGLWKNSLLEDMLWRVTRVEAENKEPEPRKPSRRPRQWRAPSWSWASLKCPIEYNFRTKTPSERYVEVVEASCVPATADDTGEILLAEVVLLGRLIPATWWERIVLRPENGRYLHLKLNDSDAISWFNRLDDFRYPIPSAQPKDFWFGWPLDVAGDPMSHDYEDYPSPIMPKEQIYCLPMVEFASQVQGGYSQDVYLLLMQVEPGSTQYRRAGITKVEREEDESFPFLDFPETVFTIL